MHGYQQDAIDFDNEFRAQFADHIAKQNAAQGKMPLLYDNRCGTLNWVPDPANFDSLYEHEVEIQENIDYIKEQRRVNDRTAYHRMKHPKSLPAYPGLPQRPVKVDATTVSPATTTIQNTLAPTTPPTPPPPSPPRPPSPPPHPPVIARVKKQKRFPQTSQIPPAPRDGNGDQVSSVDTSAATAISQASPLWGRWSPYGRRARAQAVHGIYAKVAAGRCRTNCPTTMWGRRLPAALKVRPSPA